MAYICGHCGRVGVLVVKTKEAIKWIRNLQNMWSIDKFEQPEF